MRLHMLRILKGFRLPVCELVSVYCLYVRPVVIGGGSGGGGTGGRVPPKFQVGG